MNNFDLLSIVVGISIFISLFLAFFLFIKNSENKLSNRLFAFFLLLTTIDATGFIDGALNEPYYGILMFRNLLIFLHLPILYLYVVSSSYANFRLKSIHLLHTLPFFLINLVHIPRFYAQSSQEKIAFLSSFKNTTESHVTHISLHIQVFIYLILIFIVLRKARKLYLENYTGNNIVSFRWLFQLSIAISLFYAIALFKNIFKFSEYDQISHFIKTGLFLINFLIICWYLFKALNNPSIFSSVDPKLKLVDTIITENALTENDKNKRIDHTELQKLNQFMEKEKPYLDSTLTVKSLAKKIDISTRDLSILINHEIGQHFFDFVNSFRIKEATEILKNPSKKHLTILEILYSVGFNSKSSFNTAFKKHTGTTPTQFRKNNS